MPTIHVTTAGILSSDRIERNPICATPVATLLMTDSKTSLDVNVTLVGGPTLLIEIAGVRLLSDPTFDPPSRYESGSIVLEKTAGPAISSEEIGLVDAVLLSHDQHFDNFDRAGRTFAANVKTVFTTPSGAERLGKNAKGLAPWETATVNGKAGARLSVTATPARHGPTGFEPISGEVAGFVVGVDRLGDSVYLTGDTVWYEGIAEVARRFKPRLVVVFAGSAKPRGPFRVTMDNNDTIETAHAFPQARIIAIHNQGWKHFTETQEDAVRAFTALGINSRLQTLELGKALHLQI
jgi:L-ascorbate metabolism protein UlaG (beta-lactamase superfamily)